jgi:hypothetical protein
VLGAGKMLTDESLLKKLALQKNCPSNARTK